MRKIITALLLLFALFQTEALHAQDLLKGSDLSTVKVDYLSDTEIAKIKTQLQANNTTIEQVEPMALAKGMSATEFAKLKARLGVQASKKEVVNKDNSGDNNEEYTRKQEKIVNKKVKDSLNSLVFGSELFDNPTLNFEPNLKLATPVNYVLGPGDELQVSVYGVQEFNASIPVTMEGKLNIQYVGEISVAGMTIEAATQKIKGAMARVYSTVQSGQSQVGVSLSRIRTIKVTLIGSKQPGNYSISSLATVYNALFLGGGPGKNGSYRNIELLRNNNKAITDAFDLKFWGVPEIFYPSNIQNLQAAFGSVKPNDVEFYRKSLVEGLNLFEKIFNFKSETFIANNYTWSDPLNNTLYENGIIGLQGMKYQKVPLSDGCGIKLRPKFTGKINELGQVYMVRNCVFEPSQMSKSFNNVDNCLSNITNAFFFNKPAIITSHRLNFIGVLSKENRDLNLLMLDKLIKTILEKWPDVIFMTSNQLAQKLHHK